MQKEFSSPAGTIVKPPGAPTNRDKRPPRFHSILALPLKPNARAVCGPVMPVEVGQPPLEDHGMADGPESRRG